MYAPAFDPTPQAGDMVVSRSDVKRRRKEGNILEESLQTSPKRTKVHAQRKFAQGSSNMSSPALTPVKDKDKVKTNGTVLSPELIPTKRPKTEDFLTFLCFRGTQILPPCLDFFNIATVQETPDEEQGSSMGDCSRESTRNSRIASSSVGSGKLQRADRNVAEAASGSGVIRKFDRSENVRRRKPPTAVQALKRKYQEQRLAKQRASTLKTLAQKVKGKNIVKTRSAAHNEERRTSMRTRGSIVKKTVRSVKLVQKNIRSAPKADSLNKMPTRNKAVVKSKARAVAHSIRRDGLRSGGQLPPGSEAGLKSERVLRQPEQLQPRFKPVVKKKKIVTYLVRDASARVPNHSGLSELTRNQSCVSWWNSFICNDENPKFGFS